MTKTILALSAVLAAAIPAAAQTAADSAAIRVTALDYIEGYYAGDAARMERAVHPELAKRIVRTRDGRSMIGHMTAAQLVDGTRAGGGRDAPVKRTDVKILDIFGNTASVRVDAGEWVDYMHLAVVDGRWRIINVLWELRRG